MRPLLLSFLIVPSLAFAQTLPYHRVEAIGPAVPDGNSYVTQLTNGGWSLVSTSAANLSNPARYPYQYYFRSPQGALTRLPLEQAGLSPSDNMATTLSPDGATAVVASFGTNPGAFVRFDRDGVTIRVYLHPGTYLSPVAIVGRYLFFTDAEHGLGRLDLDSGAETAYPRLVADLFAFLRGVTSDGSKAVYQTSTGFVVKNLANGIERSWTLPTGFVQRTLDLSARYVWYRMPAAGTAGPSLHRHDLFTGADLSYPDPISGTAVFPSANDRFLFFMSDSALSPNDDNTTRDGYVFDKNTGAATLVTDRKGSHRAAGGVSWLVPSPDGSKVMFTSDAAGVADLPASRFGQLYVRSQSRSDTQPALAAQGPSGGEASSAGVLSRGGKAVLYSRFSADQWSLRIVLDGQSTQVIPTSEYKTPLDVTDDGRMAMWAGADGKTLFASFDGVVRPMDLGGGAVLKARIDPLTGIPLATIQRYDANGNASREVTRFDPATGAATRMDKPAPLVNPDFDADAGRVAWQKTGAIRVVDLRTGAKLDIPTAANTNIRPPRLTADGLYVAIPQLSKYGIPVSTRLYRISDGAFRRTLPFGDLLPDGTWLRNGRGGLVYAQTGAELLPTIEDSIVNVGDPVGPESLTWKQIYYNEASGPALGDLWRFRSVALREPKTIQFGTLPREGGKIEIAAFALTAGLENAATWNEVRVDGAGAWQRLSSSGDSTITLPDGPHRLEVRAADALGRVETTPKSANVVADSTPPSVGAVSATITGPQNVDLFVVTDAFTARAEVTDPNGVKTFIVDPVHQNGGFLARFGEMRYKGVYHYHFILSDRLGNTTTSAEGSFTKE